MENPKVHIEWREPLTELTLLCASIDAGATDDVILGVLNAVREGKRVVYGDDVAATVQIRDRKLRARISAIQAAV